MSLKIYITFIFLYLDKFSHINILSYQDFKRFMLPYHVYNIFLEKMELNYKIMGHQNAIFITQIFFYYFNSFFFFFN